jgi:UDP-glucose 4-epimerase
MPSRLLITGAAGFVGARVVRQAVGRGLDVVAAVGPTSRLDRIADLAGRIEIVRADVTDREALTAAVLRAQPDACIHLAATGSVVRDPDPSRVLATNALATATLIQALAQTRCARLVSTGSSSEYGPMDGPMDETRLPEPADPYGVAKLAGGKLAHVLGRELGLETAHLRLFSIYGPGEDSRRLIASLVRGLLTGRPVELTPGGQVRDFVYVDDAAGALLLAALRPGIDRLTVNVGSGIETSVREVAELAGDLTETRHLLRFGARPYRDGERFAWRAGTERAASELGWRATTSLREGLTRTIAHEAGRASELVAAA